MKSPNVLPIICSAEKGRGCKKKNISFWKINASFQKVETFRFADYTYALPVIVSLLNFKKDKIVIIENPEAHIHPRGQAEMGRLIALAAAAGMQLFVETHSDHIVNGIRVAVKENLINAENVNISYFSRQTTEIEQFCRIQNIRVDRTGELSDYPIDFMDEWNNQLLKLI